MRKIHFHNKNLPNQMMESNDLLYIAIPGDGVAVFDVFGSFIKLVPCKPDRISVVQNYLLVREGTIIKVFTTDNFLDSGFTYEVPKGVSEFSFANDLVYLLTERGFFIGRYIED